MDRIITPGHIIGPYFETFYDVNGFERHLATACPDLNLDLRPAGVDFEKL